MKPWCGAVLLLAGCGGGEKHATAPTTAAQSRPVSPPKADLSESRAVRTVSIPGDVDVAFHFEAPESDLSSLSNLGLTLPKLDVIMKRPLMAVDLVAGQAVGEHVDVTRPIDLLVSANREKRVWSVAFTPVADDLDELALTRIAEGRWLIERPEGELPKPAAERCELWHGAAPSGYRIVCSDYEERLDLHGPYYLAEGARSGANIEVRVSAARLTERIRQNARGADGATSAGRAVQRVGRKLMYDFLAEQEVLGLEIWFKPTGLEFALELGFTSTRSPFALWWTGGANGPRSISPTFYRLPGDAEVKFFKAGAEPSEMARAGQPVFDEMLRVVLDDYSLTDAQQADVAKTLRGLLPSGGAASVAFGQDRAKVGAALEAVGAEPEAPVSRELHGTTIADLKRSVGGWVVIGLEEEPQSYLESVRSMVRFTKLKRKSEAEVAEEVSAEKGGLSEKAEYNLTAAPATLPKATLHLVRSCVPNPSYEAPAASAPPVSSQLHLFFVPDGGRTWIAISQDAELAVAHAKAALRGDGAPSAEFGALAAERIGTLGSFSIASLVSLAMDGDSADERRAIERALTSLGALPHRGETRIPIWMELEKVEEPASKEALSSRLVARLSPEVVADLVALLRQEAAP